MNGHCNGTRSSTLPTVNRLSGIDAGRVIIIPRISLQSSDKDLSFSLKRLEFPKRSAFHMSINRSQGQSLSRRRCIYQLLYEAISRVGKPEDVY